MWLSRSCQGCSAEYSWTRSFLNPPWILFEVFAERPNVVSPSFELSISSHAYRLAAVIYGHASNFVTLPSTPSGTWWYYDGQKNDGRPAVDSITREEDLITCEDGYAMNVLVYYQIC